MTKHLKNRNSFLLLSLAIVASTNLFGTSATPTIEPIVDQQEAEKRKIFQQFHHFKLKVDATTNPDNPERRAKLLQWAPVLMRDIVTRTFTQNGDQIFRTLEDYRKVVSCAAISWPYYITVENNHEILKWMNWAAQFADKMIKTAHRDDLKGDDFRHAAGLYHSLGVRQYSKEYLANAEKYFNLLLNRFANILVSDYANAANTQMSLAHFAPEQRKFHYTNALNLLNRAMELINASPLELLHMHLPFAKDLRAIAKQAATKYISAKPLATKFDAYVANIERRINELEPQQFHSITTPSPSSSLTHTPAPSPSPTAQTEGPTPDADSISGIEMKMAELKKMDNDDEDL